MTTHRDGKDYTISVDGYDERGRATGRTWTFPAGLGGALHQSSYRVNYGYDAADHTVSIEYEDAVIGAPREKITTSYDAQGNPDTLTGVQKDPLTGKDVTVPYVSATGFAADGKLASRDYANPHHDLRRVYAYESDSQRLSRVQTLTTGLTGDWEARQDDTYAWDQAGNLDSITDRTGHKDVASCFTYDGLARLQHAWTTYETDCSDSDSELVHDGPAGFNQSWTYTADGNIASRRSLLDTDTYTYGDSEHPHAVTKQGASTYGYDENGALKKKTDGLVPTTYEWNANQELTRVTKALLEKTDFVYAPDGTRMARITPGGVATLYIEGQEITVALGISKGTRFYTEDGITVAVRQPTGVLVWQLNDIQGSAQVAVVAGTSLATRTYYNPYGDIRHGSAPPPTDHG